jgi:hypothetical protein
MTGSIFAFYYYSGVDATANENVAEQREEIFGGKYQ